MTNPSSKKAATAGLLGTASGIPAFGRIPGAARTAYRKLQTRLIYRSFAHFAESIDGFDGKWVKDEERTPENESLILERIARSFISMTNDQGNTDSLYLPSHEWKRLLESQWIKHREAIVNQRYPELGSLLRNLFRNESITGFWGGEDMFQTFEELPLDRDVPRAITMLKQLAAWKRQCPASDVTELDVPRIGNPWGYSFDGALLYEPAFEYDYHSKYFTRLLAAIEKPVVLEIGGGFGGLAYHLLKRNPNVTYIGIDLPENVIIQFYYLSCAYPHRRTYLYGDQTGGIGDEAISEYDIILLPNFALPNIRASRVDLVANVRSLSEMSMETIIEYHRQIERMNPLFFFHENIAAERRDALHGIPSTDFPLLENYCLLMSCESRWPRYSRNSTYPCKENLYIRRDAIG